MPRRRLGVLAFLLVAAAPVPRAAPAEPAEVVRRVGRVTIRVDLDDCFPGGVAVVRLGGAQIGAAWALLDGRRAPFYPHKGIPRALVPVATSAEPGVATLGIEIAARRREQRIAVPVQIAARPYPPRGVLLSAAARALLERPEVIRDARRLLGHVRTESPRRAPGPLTAPVAASGQGFGERRSHAGATDAESRIDALGGERHRGLDYAVPLGTTVRAPGSGLVLFAGPLVLSGETVVLDHGQGVVSVLQHLSRVDVRAGEEIAGGAEIGRSGSSGLATEPMLQWRVYLHGVPVDPRVIAPLLG